jgi:hypothetical protein
MFERPGHQWREVACNSHNRSYMTPECNALRSAKDFTIKGKSENLDWWKTNFQIVRRILSGNLRVQQGIGFLPWTLMSMFFNKKTIYVLVKLFVLDFVMLIKIMTKVIMCSIDIVSMQESICQALIK